MKNLKTILILNGPNLNLTGVREPGVYGCETLRSIEDAAVREAQSLGFSAECFQSNHEGALIDRIHLAREEGVCGIVFNPGAFTHYSYALRDAIAAVNIPTVEVHLSNVFCREAFRRESVIAPVCLGQIAGLAGHGYSLAVRYLATIFA